MNNRELTHHGILGMKWGVQNGPPYPLAPGDHSASERRAGWRKSLERANAKQRITDAKKRYNSSVKKTKTTGILATREAAEKYRRAELDKEAVQKEKENYKKEKLIYKYGNELGNKKYDKSVFRKYGLPGSAKDQLSNWKASEYWDSREKEAGAEYMNQVRKEVLGETLTIVAASMAVYAGTMWWQLKQSGTI